MEPATAAKTITAVLRGGDMLMSERLGRQAQLNETITCVATRGVYCEPYHHGAQQPNQEEGPGCAMRGHYSRIDEVQRRWRYQAVGLSTVIG